MKLSKMVLFVIVIAALFLFVRNAQGEYLNLNKEKILMEGVCEVYKKRYSCVILQHKKKTYYVVFDKRGRDKYQIELLPDGSYKLLWVKGPKI